MGRRARLRVRLGPGLADLDTGTGHGNLWRHGLTALRATGEVKLVDSGRADVWLASGHAPPPQAAGPLVAHVHEIGWVDPELRAFLAPEFAERIEADTATALAAADEVITLSNSTRSQVLSLGGMPEDRVHTVHPGVDTNLFRAGTHGADFPYVLFTGVLHPRKNYGVLRKAVAGLANRGLPHKLVLIGNLAMDRVDGPEFEREAESPLPGLPDRVLRFKELPDEEVAALTAGAEAFCLPSFYEGFGLPALEAMACGTPVVVSNRGALPEVVGDAGLVVEPTTAAVEEALHRVLTDRELADRLRAAGQERARSFTWERTAEGWLRVLRRAA
jgi:glycosyltransferase involved in cell wall biosynthesis